MTSFSSDDELYVSWFCGNKGATTSSDFASKLFVDGKCVWSWGAASGLQNGQGVFWKGLAIGKLSVGSHVMTIVYDYDGQIAESDENNNSYSVTITVSDPLPDLCFFSPEGWATWPHPVFLSNEQNANSAKTSFAEGETIYLNCRFGNKGTTAIARDYRIIHEVLNSSGSVRSSSFYDCTSVEWCAPGEARQWGDSVWPILQGLPVGNYTYRCRLDSNHVIDESDESNNDITIDFKVMSSVQKYTVAFNANGGMFGNAAYSSVVVEQGKSTMQAGASGTKASRTGYALVGWFDTTNSAGGNIVFDARGYAVNGKYWEGAYSPKVSSAKWKHSGNVVAYARWVKTPPCRVVTFDANGGVIGNAAYAALAVEIGKNTNQAGASGTKAARAGYSLVGWFDTTNSAGGNMVFDARGYAVNGKYWNGAYSPKVSAATWKFAGNVTAYARWVKTPPYRVVTFDANGGTVSNASYAALAVEIGKSTNQAGASPKVSSAKWKYAGNVVAYARWVKTPPYRVVTFDANGGVIGNAAYAAVAVEIGKNTNQAGASGTKSVRTGYTLVGWFDTTNSAGGNILFDARGYAVNGKYWEGAYSPKASSAKWRHAGSVTAYARWVKSPPFRVVTLDANGGAISNAAYAAVVVEDGKATMQAGAFGTKAARAGYSLVGWFDTTNSAGGNIVFDAHGYAVNGKYWDGAYDPGKTAAKWKFSGNVTAYARWIAQGQLGKYTATLNANGGSIGGQPFLSAQTEYGKYTNQAAANRAVTREGYSLVGWFDADGNMVFDARGYAVNGKYWDGAYSPKVSSAKWKYAGNVVAYARWVKTPPYRVVTFDANGGTISNAAYAAAVVEDGKYTMQAGASGTKVARAFYTLVGWFDTTNATGGNVVFDARGYAVSGKYWNGSYEPGKTSATWKYAGNVVAYARWTPAKYTVTLNANGGSVSSQPTVAVQVEYGRYTSQAGANRTVSRSGYRLVGWYDTTAASGGNIVFDARGYAVSGKYWNGSYEPGKTSATWKHVGNVTAYARWAQVSNKYTVTLNANGGTVDGQPGVSFQVEVGKSTSQAGAKRSVERSGYMLRGWYDMDGNIVFDAMGYAVDGKYWDGDYWPNSSSAGTWRTASVLANLSETRCGSSRASSSACSRTVAVGSC